MKKALIILIVVMYFVWPIDLCPGMPVDDIVVVALGLMAMNNLSSSRKQKMLENENKLF